MSDKRPPHDAGASSPHLRNFPLRVSGASSTMSDMHPPHVYGSSSPHRRNIITHFETSPQHVYGASSLHLKNFFSRVSQEYIYIYIYIWVLNGFRPPSFLVRTSSDPGTCLHRSWTQALVSRCLHHKPVATKVILRSTACCVHP